MGRVMAISKRPVSSILLSALAFAFTLTACYYFLPVLNSRLQSTISIAFEPHDRPSLLIPRTFFPPETDGSPSLLQDAALTHNGGFLRLLANETSAIGYGVSMYHQIHCIEMLREALVPSESSEDHHHHHYGETVTMPGEETDHLIHCLDYLAQVSRRVTFFQSVLTMNTGVCVCCRRYDRAKSHQRAAIWREGQVQQWNRHNASVQGLRCCQRCSSRFSNGAFAPQNASRR
jgi:hypothetical protein